MRLLSYTIAPLWYCKILDINFKERLIFLGTGAYFVRFWVGDNKIVQFAEFACLALPPPPKELTN
jgi:hypothetical protein